MELKVLWDRIGNDVGLNYWIDIFTCKDEGVPFLVVRYEDLVLDAEAETLRVMKFLIGQHGDVEACIRHDIGKSRQNRMQQKHWKGLNLIQPRKIIKPIPQALQILDNTSFAVPMGAF